MRPADRQRVYLAARGPEATRSRPLLTGKQYRLVLPDRRLISATWDKAGYRRGDQARLSVSGRNLGSEALQLVIETEQAPGVFAEVARVPAEIAADGTSARVGFSFPAPRPTRTGGHLLSVSFSPAAFEAGAAVILQVQAEGLAGAAASIELERELPGGVWESVAELPLALGESGGEVRFRVDAPPAPAPAPESCTFQSLADGAAWLQARAPALEGKSLQFVLEREAAPGHYVEVGQAVATVRCGEARASVQLPTRTT